MRLAVLVSFLGLARALTGPAYAGDPPLSPATVGDHVEEIQETTVGTLSGVDVGVANMWEREYTDGAGASRKGLTARLDYDANGSTVRTVVGQGSIFLVGGQRWEVIRLNKPPSGNGSVTLRLLPSP